LQEKVLETVKGETGAGGGKKNSGSSEKAVQGKRSRYRIALWAGTKKAASREQWRRSL